MGVLRSLIRVTGAVSASIALTCTVASTAVAGPPDPDVTPEAAVAAADRADTAGPSDLLAAYQLAVDNLKQIGVQPFLYPTASAFCHDGTTAGLVPAMAGAVPGPWPKPTVAMPGLDTSAVKSGQTMFAFVPYGLAADGADTSGMQVAWFNANTGRGGFAAMNPMSQVVKAMVPANVPAEVRPLAEQAVQNFFAAALPAGGVRAVPVDTGHGTVLAAMFGSVRNGDHTCYFLPTVGMVPVP
uniref:Uncharacterized protein n=1 Tax=Nocardia transvalensis TaxID=37333 RepID=A0A7W9UMP7_9NOCA|nr:hypothetical protein [Nocardia transvalensis]MBB5917985.1 hypothetical protein [Nocardia transvalensis]